MTTLENKQIVLRYLTEVVNGRRFDLTGAILSPDFAIDHAGVPWTTKTPAGFTLLLGGFVKAFPDLRVTIDEVIAEGDAVAVRLGWTGTHQGEFNGLRATGRPFTVSGGAVYHVIDGRITRGWVEFDTLSLLQQIGTATVFPVVQGE